MNPEPIIPLGTDITNSVPPILPAQPDREYIVVTDNTSEVLLSTNDRHEAQKFAGKVRRAGGSVTVFKALQL